MDNEQVLQIIQEDKTADATEAKSDMPQRRKQSRHQNSNAVHDGANIKGDECIHTSTHNSSKHSVVTILVAKPAPSAEQP